MTHLSSHKQTEFEIIMKRIYEEKIPCYFETRNNIIVHLDTEDEELIAYAKLNNPDLVDEEETE